MNDPVFIHFINEQVKLIIRKKGIQSASTDFYVSGNDAFLQQHPSYFFSCDQEFIEMGQPFSTLRSGVAINALSTDSCSKDSLAIWAFNM